MKKPAEKMVISTPFNLQHHVHIQVDLSSEIGLTVNIILLFLY